MTISGLTIVLLFARTAIVVGTILEKFQNLDNFVVDHHKEKDKIHNRGYQNENKVLGYDPSRKYDPSGKSEGAFWYHIQQVKNDDSSGSKDVCWCLRLHHEKGSSTYTLTSCEIDGAHAAMTSASLKFREIQTFTEEELKSEYQRQLELNRKIFKEKVEELEKEELEKEELEKEEVEKELREYKKQEKTFQDAQSSQKVKLGELENLRKTEGELNRENTRLSTKNRNQIRDIRKRQSEIIELEKEVADLKNKNEQSQKQIQVAQQKLASQADAQEQLRDLREKQANLSAEKDDLSKKLKSTERTIISEGEVAREEVRKLKADLENAENQISELKAKHEDLEQFEELKTEMIGLKKKIEHSEKENQSLKRSSDKEILEQAAQFDVQIQELRQELEHSGEEVEGLRTEHQSQMDALNERLRQTEEERDSMGVELNEQREKADEDQIVLEECQHRAESLENENADLQRDLDESQQAVIDVEEKLRQNVEKNDHWMMMAAYIGGGAVVVIGFIIFVLSRRTYKKMSDDMEYELNAQLKRVKEPHPLVPGYPSAHANRLGVHEHPAVRDVFGMKEPWGVTPGEGFHVSRITGGQDTTRGTTRESTELNEGDEGPDVPQIPGPSENVSEKEDPQRPSVVIGLPPPHRYVGNDEGNDVVIEIPHNNQGEDREDCVSGNVVEVPNDAEEEAQAQIAELYKRFDI